MTTKTRTSYTLIHEKIDEIITEYMKQFELIKYFNQHAYELNWGKHIKRSRLTEMICNKKYERWGDIEIKLNDDVRTITCYSVNGTFTAICKKLEKLLHDKINIDFDVVIVKEYCDLK